MEEEKGKENILPLLGDIISDPSQVIIKKKDQEMRDTFEKYSKLLNKMKKIVNTMGNAKLMNYQNLFNEYNNDVIKLKDEEKKLVELKDILENEGNLPNNIQKNLKKVNNDLEIKKDVFQRLNTKVEEYKDKYTKDENKKYDEMFKEQEEKKEENDEVNEQKLIVKNNDEIMEERKNMIEEAKKTSSKVVDTSKIINNVVHQQGENINDIENNIIEAVDNFKKGGEEINKFKKTTENKISTKKLLVVGCGILILMLFIYFLLKKLF